MQSVGLSSLDFRLCLFPTITDINCLKLWKETKSNKIEFLRFKTWKLCIECVLNVPSVDVFGSCLNMAAGALQGEKWKKSIGDDVHYAMYDACFTTPDFVSHFGWLDVYNRISCSTGCLLQEESWRRLKDGTGACIIHSESSGETTSFVPLIT